MRDKGKYYKIGLTIFWVVAALILFFFAVFRFSAIIGFIKLLFKVLSPVIIGAILAYLLNPVTKGMYGWIMKLTDQSEDKPHTREVRIRNKVFHFKAKELKFRTREVIANAISIIVSIGGFIAFVSILFRIVIPEVYESILLLSSNLMTYGNAVYDWANNLFVDDPELHSMAQEVIDSGYNFFTEWFNNDFLASIQKMLGPLMNGVTGVVKGVINAFLGICVAVYLMLSREKLVGQSKKLMYSVCKKERANMYLAIVRQVDSIFGGFITGKIVDSIIIGVLCFIGASILKIPYVALVAVVIGVTNIIPIFGPFIGAVPCAFLILILDPMKCLVFIIFILVLQQIDGNIIGPFILGESTGLSAFWVVVAITVGGGFFGFFGMLLGVPTFAVIYFLMKTFFEIKLKEKNLPISSISYTRIKRIDPETNKAEFIDYTMSKQEKKKQKVIETELSQEIEIVAEMEKKRRAKRKNEETPS